MKNILISGGAGFIGSGLTAELVRRGYTVTVLDNLSPQVHGMAPPRTSYCFHSIRDISRFIHGDVTVRED